MAFNADLGAACVQISNLDVVLQEECGGECGWLERRIPCGQDVFTQANVLFASEDMQMPMWPDELVQDLVDFHVNARVPGCIENNFNIHFSLSGVLCPLQRAQQPTQRGGTVPCM